MNEDIIQALKANHGEKADSMACFCEVKFISEDTDWFCYVYALDPIDCDTIECIIPGPRVTQWSLISLLETYNHHGEYVQIDKDFRPMRACELFRKLNE